MMGFGFVRGQASRNRHYMKLLCLGLCQARRISHNILLWSMDRFRLFLWCLWMWHHVRSLGDWIFYDSRHNVFLNDNAHVGSEAVAGASVVEPVVGVPAIVPLIDSSVCVVHVAIAQVVMRSVVVPDSRVSDSVSGVLIVGACTFAPI